MNKNHNISKLKYMNNMTNINDIVDMNNIY